MRLDAITAFDQHCQVIGIGQQQRHDPGPQAHQSAQRPGVGLKGASQSLHGWRSKHLIDGAAVWQQRGGCGGGSDCASLHTRVQFHQQA